MANQPKNIEDISGPGLTRARLIRYNGHAPLAQESFLLGGD